MSSTPYKFLFALAFAVTSGDAIKKVNADFSFASYYGDNMVLQAAPYPANVWGYSTKVGDTVTVTVEGKSAITTTVKSVEGRGMWLARLPSVEAGLTALTVTADSSLGTIQLKNVLFGDVWLCSGQSNMQFTLDMADNATQEMQDSENYPNIRVFTVQLNQSNTPLYDLLEIEEPWSIPSPDTVGNNPWTYFSAVCWLYGKYLYQSLNKPIGLIASSWGGTRIETWSTNDSLSKCSRHEATSPSYKQYGSIPSADSVLWNAMIHPFLNMTIYGVIWYQGESNADNPELYNCTFPAMIDDWRMKFHEGSQGTTSDQFPFGFVQLAANRNNASIQTGFPGIRWSQTVGLGYVPNTRMNRVFMAVAMDLPDFTSPYGSIHPRDKQDVCRRLANAGLSVAYNKSGISYKGPLPGLYIITKEQENIQVVYFPEIEGENIEVRSKDGFEICCPNGASTDICTDPSHIWIPAVIQSSNTNTVNLTWTESCDEIHGIRYAWRESPCPFKQCAVYWEKSGLPAPPTVSLF